MGTTKIQKRGPDTNQITGQMILQICSIRDLDLQQMKNHQVSF